MVAAGRRQRFFKTKEEAQSWLSQVRWQHPTEQFWQSLPVIEREKIMLSYKSNDNSPQMKPEMVSIAVRRYIELKSKLNLRPTTIQQIRWKLGMLDHYFGTYHCHQLTTEMLETWFADREWKRSTIEGVIAKIGPFFNWCKREMIIVNNPLKCIILPKDDEYAPCIFSSSDVSKLLTTARANDPGLVPYLALGVFAGIRPDEIMRLNWRDIGQTDIEIGATKAKTRKRRLVTLSPNLSDWLALGGALPPQNKRKRIEDVRKACGVTWGHDIMRHSFASYHLAFHCSPDKTSHELGHRDTSMLYRHYRELVSKSEAEIFWQIKPDNTVLPRV